MAVVPVQFIPESKTPAIQAQVNSDAARIQASLWQSANENAVRQALGEQEVQMRRDALEQARLEREKGQAFDLEKLRLAHTLSMLSPQEQLAQEQLGAYKQLSPQEKMDKLMGRGGLDQERLNLERQRLEAETKRAEKSEAFNISKLFEAGAQKGRVSDEDAFKAWMKVSGDIAKNPQISNIEQQLGLYSGIVADTPGSQQYGKYLDLAKSYFLKPEVEVSNDVRKRQAQNILSMLNSKKEEFERSKLEIERFRISPEIYNAKAQELVQEGQRLKALEASTTKFLYDLYHKDKGTSWWDSALKQAPALATSLSPATGGPLGAYYLGYKGLKNLFGGGEK